MGPVTSATRILTPPPPREVSSNREKRSYQLLNACPEAKVPQAKPCGHEASRFFKCASRLEQASCLDFEPSLVAQKFGARLTQVLALGPFTKVPFWYMFLTHSHFSFKTNKFLVSKVQMENRAAPRSVTKK